MNGPLWIAAVSLLFWGWESDSLILAALMAVASVGPAFSARRFALGQAEFHRALDVCWVLGIGGLLLVYSREPVGNVFRTFAQWLPLAALPGYLAHIWSTTQRVPTSALVPLPRWRNRAGHANPALDLRSAFITVCLLSTSIAGAARPWFYPATLVVLGAALWLHRSRSASLASTLLLFAVAALGGWGIASGLARAQPWIENRVLEWTSRLDRDGAPSRISRTSIGHRGRVGGSSRVVLQVRTEGPAAALPNLFRVATFSAWRDGAWYATLGGFEKLEPQNDEWVILEGTPTTSTLHLEWARSTTSDLVPHPGSTRAIRELLADKLERSPMGTLRAETRPGVVSLRADLGAAAPPEIEPAEEDRGGIPPLEKKTIDRLAAELDLAGQPAAEVVARIERFFFTKFEYTLDLIDEPIPGVEAPTPLARFLLGHRRGHCEYFATAATLLLRSAGVPARYVTGFLVSPTERSEGFIVVRENQAHAWVRVWNGTTWQDFDPTPPVGLDALVTAPTWWERLQRSWHENTFGLVRWWWLGEKRLLRQAYWLALPLLAILLWRFRTLRAARPASSSTTHPNERPWPGLDSEWYQVEQVLEEHGWSRQNQEPPPAWDARLTRGGWAQADTDHLHRTLHLHRRLRFDPRGIPGPERDHLRHLARQLATRLASLLRPPSRD
ncbi:MAG: transglutaminase domain-containing protein [Verrucomicrobiales bacterium]|nr:transglutaminase domain-containing protein [Verrucomicrobiales bacterium]